MWLWFIGPRDRVRFCHPTTIPSFKKTKQKLRFKEITRLVKTPEDGHPRALAIIEVNTCQHTHLGIFRPNVSTLLQLRGCIT